MLTPDYLVSITVDHIGDTDHFKCQELHAPENTPDAACKYHIVCTKAKGRRQSAALDQIPGTWYLVYFGTANKGKYFVHRQI